MTKWKEAAEIAPKVIQNVFTLGRAAHRGGRKVGAVKGATERETELLKRLRRLEGVVEELSGQVEIETIKAASVPAKQAKSGGSDGEYSNKGRSCESSWHG